VRAPGLGHRRYFARQSRREGFELNDDVLTVFERFEVVWPLDDADVASPRDYGLRLIL
jgi:hypothetical protein